MRFYWQSGYCGDWGLFSEKNLIKAIYSAWNIESELFIVPNGTKPKDIENMNYSDMKLIFAPFEDNEFNSDILKEYGYKMIDGIEEREIVSIEDGSTVKYNWSEVKQLR